MDIPLNADIECTDGHCGRCSHVVLNPTTQVVTHIVVKADAIPHTKYLIPVGQITQTTPDMIKLDLDSDELLVQQAFIGSRFVHIEHPPFQEYPFIAWPYALPRTVERIMVHDLAIPPGEMAVHRGAKVEATDGTIGQADEFLVDRETGHITHLILGEGHPWGKTEVAIPVSAIKTFGQERIYLGIDKRTVATLPEVPIERRYELALMVEIEKYIERETKLETRVTDLANELDSTRTDLLERIDNRFETLSEEIDVLKEKLV